MTPERFDELRMGFMVLTRLPAGQIGGEPPSVSDSAWSWPLVGLAVGAISALVWALALTLGLPPLLSAALAILAGMLATGGLHEDGLADLADGLGGGRDRAGALDIMRDSRIGSYGALALGFSLLVRIGALATLSGGTGVLALLGLGAASRAGLPLALRLMPPARADGLGEAARGVRETAARSALIIGALALFPLGLGAAILTGGLMALAALALAAYSLRRIGGQTGDVLGALQQVAELAGWCALATLAA
jgi:adenosylcobinamide-GDP ribazoletransferase